MMINRLTDGQKEQISEHVKKIAKFETGDLVTVDYKTGDNWFANAEYGGVPLRIKEVTWRGFDVDRVSKSSYHRYNERDEIDRLLHLFDPAEIHPESQHTKYVTVKPSYRVEVAVNAGIEAHHLFGEPCLIEWDDYDGHLQFQLRDTDARVSLREGESCRVCGFSAEKVAENSLPDGTRYGAVSCAVCGYVKEQHAP